jgi:hypothetical protein
MSSAAKISNGTNFRKVYLSDLSLVLEIYKSNQESTENEAYAFQIEKLTAQFGLPLAIAECNNELIGFTSAKMNALEEIEFTSYYKNGVGRNDIQSDLEQMARNTFNSTFNHGPGAEIKLSNAAHRLIDWLNKCI